MTEQKVQKVKRTERGWAGHFIAAHSCKFRRNTLLELGETRIVISTVGLMVSHLADKTGYQQIGYGRYFETRAFYSDPEDTRYHDADVTKVVEFDSPWAIDETDADDKANEMHERVVEELTEKLEKGELNAAH